jgi:hypothetical protein
MRGRAPVEQPVEPPDAFVHQRTLLGRGGVAELAQRRLSQADGARCDRGGVQGVRGAHQQLGPLDAWIGQPVVEPQRPLELFGRVGVSVHPLCFPARLKGGRERLDRHAAGVPVVRQERPAHVLVQPPGPLDRPRRVKMQPLTFAGQQIVVERLAHQRVAEPARVAVDHQHLVQDGLTQRCSHRLAGDLLQQHVVHLVAQHGCDVQHRLCRLGQPLDTGQDYVGQRGGHAVVDVAGGHELLDVERVAVAARKQFVHDLVGRRIVADLAEQPGQLVTAQPGQHDPLDLRAAFQVSNHRTQRMAAMQVVSAVGEQ